jgi:hypothetical protein
MWPIHKTKKVTKIEQYCKFPERNGIFQFDKNNVLSFKYHANFTL